MVSDWDTGAPVPHFGLEDVVRLADFIERHYLQPPDRPALEILVGGHRVTRSTPGSKRCSCVSSGACSGTAGICPRGRPSSFGSPARRREGIRRSPAPSWQAVARAGWGATRGCSGSATGDSSRSCWRRSARCFRRPSSSPTRRRPTQGLGVPVVPDRIPDKGPLAGIHAALCSSRFPYTFCIACDMPLVNPAVVAHLCALGPGYDAVVPEWEAGYEPLHALYGQILPLRTWSGWSARTGLRVDALFSAVRVRRVVADELRPLDPLLRSFLNVNTPDELEVARRILEQGGDGACAS
ncbi:MAG: NTP transferase domain-containing protein [Ignavibacteriales bacterium]|nr:NTP transferase domain-containing protein [Ignavibacteriales bacterium]